jgi:CrcB protein
VKSALQSRRRLRKSTNPPHQCGAGARGTPQEARQFRSQEGLFWARYNRGLQYKAGVAQSVEQLIRNEKVGCSIHLSGTRKTKKPPQSQAAGAFFLQGARVIPSIACVAAGAALGALLRWGLSTQLNPFSPAMPLGTLAANLIGGYLVGVAIALFATAPQLSPQLRLFVITGFLGGLTTFSTFSAEVVTQLQQGHTAWALATAFAHLLGSFALTALGIATVGWVKQST